MWGGPLASPHSRFTLRADVGSRAPFAALCTPPADVGVWWRTESDMTNGNQSSPPNQNNGGESILLVYHQILGGTYHLRPTINSVHVRVGLNQIFQVDF